LILRHSPRTNRAQARLLQSYNDIDVFVEDIATQNLYVRLFSRMLGNRRTLTSVIPLDGRQNVLDRCAADQLPRGRPRIYVIDGDLDLLTGAPRPRLKYFYRLKAYCSENLVSTEHAATLVAQEGRPSDTYATLKKLLAIDDILVEAERRLFPLFVLYAAVHRLGLSVITVGYPVIRLLTSPDDPASLSPDRIRARMRDVLREVEAAVPRAAYVASKRAIRKQVATTRIRHSELISGKAYLLPLIQLQLKRLAGIQCSKSTLSVRLATHCEMNVDTGLERALKQAVRSR